jgi:hypothetical protein
MTNDDDIGLDAEDVSRAGGGKEVSALKTVDFLREEAARGSVEDWEFVLSRVPSRPPLPGDETAP